MTEKKRQTYGAQTVSERMSVTAILRAAALRARRDFDRSHERWKVVHELATLEPAKTEYAQWVELHEKARKVLGYG